MNIPPASRRISRGRPSARRAAATLLLTIPPLALAVPAAAPTGVPNEQAQAASPGDFYYAMEVDSIEWDYRKGRISRVEADQRLAVLQLTYNSLPRGTVSVYDFTEISSPHGGGSAPAGAADLPRQLLLVFEHVSGETGKVLRRFRLPIVLDQGRAEYARHDFPGMRLETPGDFIRVWMKPVGAPIPEGSSVRIDFAYRAEELGGGR